MWMHKALHNFVWLLMYFVGREAFDPVCYKILVFLTIFGGKKRSALLQTHNWEESSFFNTLAHVIAKLYANM